MKVSVSILKECNRLDYAIKKVNESSADFLHVDVMDGKFVKNKAFLFEDYKKVAQLSKKKLDVHMMVQDYSMIEKYLTLKPYLLTFHVEIIKDSSLIKYVKESKTKVGLAINPETSIEELMPYINDIDLVLFMSVTPGKGGQTFKKEVISKIKQLKKVAPKDLLISIDGGVNKDTINLCKKAGCSMVVSGSYITNEEDYEKQIEKFKEITSKIPLNEIPIVHIPASEALINYPKLEFVNGARLGIIMYGLTDKKELDLKSPIKLISEVVQIHNLEKGETVGYNAKFVADKKTRIAVVPIGYADGIIRKNSGRSVYINDKKYKIVGNICMDMLFLEVDENVKEYDKVEIIKDNNHIEQIANYLDTITYEVLTNIGNRVIRKVI